MVKCDDYSPNLTKLPIEIRNVNIEEYGLPRSASEVHKSNIIIYNALSTEGGAWADMDIIFFKPLTALKVNNDVNKDVETFVCFSYYGHSCGFYMACPDNKYFKSLLSLCPQEYSPLIYQCIGPNLCNKYYKNLESIRKITTCADIGMDAFYAHDAYHIDYMAKPNKPLYTEWSVGLHWYGGHKPWSRFLESTNGGLVNLPPSIIADALRQVYDMRQDEIDKAKISIVMAYYNRQALLDKTIESIKRTKDTNYEIIVVDDGSDEAVVCPDAKVIRIEKKDKWWTNPCIPYNIGFKEATGDIIIIQNPECYHTGDIISYVRNNIKPNTYLSFGCYALNNQETIDFHNGQTPTINSYTFSPSARNGWYNHSGFRPKAYHFCSAITKYDLMRVGGFDEIYAQGVAFDDDDFIRTIKHIGMAVSIIDSPYVLHQFHTHFEFDSPKIFRPLHTRNQTLYNNKYPTKQKIEFKASPSRVNRVARVIRAKNRINKLQRAQLDKARRDRERQRKLRR